MLDCKLLRVQNQEVQYLRGIAMLGVIAIHTFINAPISNLGRFYNVPFIPPWWNQAILDYVSFAVPCFVLISGFVLAIHYQKNINILEFYRRRFIAILPAYIFFSLIAIAGISIISGKFAINEAIWKLLTGTASDPMWFIILILQLYILFPFIRAFSMKLWFVIFCLLIQMAGFPLLFTRYIFYFCFGIYLSDKIRGLPLFLLPLLATISILTATVRPPLLHVLVCIALFWQISGILSRQQGRISKSVHWLGDNSFALYLIHSNLVYLVTIVLLFLKVDYNYPEFCLLLFVLVIISSVVVILVLDYIPWSELIGIKKQDSISR